MIANKNNFRDFGIVIKPQYIKPWPPREVPYEENKSSDDYEEYDDEFEEADEEYTELKAQPKSLVQE